MGIVPVLAQRPYGIGDNILVPHVAPGTIVADGNADEAAWADAITVPIQNWNDWAGETPAITVDARLLWTEDTLFSYIKVTDPEVIIGSEPHNSDQILFGIDRTMKGDQQYDFSWEGFPRNFPDKGPAVLKISPAGITANWGYNNISPVDSGWVIGTTFSAADNWGVEMKIWAPRIRSNVMMGFNLGGADYTSQYDRWYAWHPIASDTLVVDYPELDWGMLASDMMRYSGCFGTLTFTGSTPYGVDQEINVPYIEPGTLKLDGEPDEPAWNDAAFVDIQQVWDGAWGGHPDPDHYNDSRILWTEDTLFAYLEVEDWQIFFGLDTVQWGGEHLMIAVDGPMYGDPWDQDYSGYPSDWAGAPWNAPDKGPTTYKISNLGITLNWGFWWHEGLETLFLVDPEDSGWVAGTVFIKPDEYKWGVEMKMYLPQVALNTRVGFNMAGAAADSATFYDNIGNEYPEATYAYYCWNGEFGGQLQQSAKSFGTLLFKKTSTGVKELNQEISETLPHDYFLDQNYPNPFNPVTSISYKLNKAGETKLEIFNVLGKKVATLVEQDQQPAGVYKVQWDATEFASGVYFYQLRVNNHLVSTKKALLIR